MEIIDMRDKAESYMMKQETMILQESRQNQISTPPTTTASPPSPSSSPTHEFSFAVAVTVHPPPLKPTQHPNSNTYQNIFTNHKTNITTTTPLQPPPAAIDLSPADDIFFQGHLLPLHHLSHLPDSPRSSTHSVDSFTLPMNLLFDFDPITTSTGNTSFHCHHQTTFSDSDEQDVTVTNQNRLKSKSFSIFGIPKWKKRHDDEREREEDQNFKKLKLDLGQLIKKYMKKVKPLLTFPKSRRSSNRKFNHQSYSFSGNSKPPAVNKRRGRFSAPASMRTSPANSGILLASGTVSPTKSTTSESSTMEELHAAIQAAIAHCKNSIAVEEDKIQSEN